MCVIFSCVFVTFPYGVPGQVWYLIVSIPDLCLLLYFVKFDQPSTSRKNRVKIVMHDKIAGLWNLQPGNPQSSLLSYKD